MMCRGGLCCRLLTAEHAGKLCRDESMEGLRFYPNEFLTRQTAR